MIEDDFYATIKFKSGEEIFAKVAASEEVNRTVLLLSNPIRLTPTQYDTFSIALAFNKLSQALILGDGQLAVYIKIS